MFFFFTVPSTYLSYPEHGLLLSERETLPWLYSTCVMSPYNLYYVSLLLF